MNITPVIIERRDSNPVLYEGEERRADWHTPADCFKMIDVQQRLEDGSGRMKRIESSIEELKANQVNMMETHARFEKKLDENSKSTADSSEAIGEVLAIISTAKGFFKGMGVIGTVLKWGLGIATAILAFVLTLKAGKGGPL